MAALPIIAMVMTGISTGIGVLSAVRQGEAQKQSAEYQAAVARNNSVIAEQRATQTEQAGVSAIQARGLKNAAALGAARAAQASNGLDVNSGTALDLQNSVETLGVQDNANSAFDLSNKAYTERLTGQNYTSQAGLLDSTAKNASAAGDINATSSFISGSTSFADKWANFGNRGMLPSFAS